MVYISTMVARFVVLAYKVAASMFCDMFPVLMNHKVRNAKHVFMPL